MGKDLLELTLEELWELFPVILREYSSEYPKWYEEEAERIKHWIGSENVFRLSHIGSSAVPGLLSKPTIDILLELNRNIEIDEILDSLGELGWILMSSQKTPRLNVSFNKGYTKEGYAEKVYHLHVRRIGDCNELYFRDYLIEHENVSIEYAKLKQDLLAKYKNDRDRYTAGKTQFVQCYTRKALAKYGKRYESTQNI